MQKQTAKRASMVKRIISPVESFMALETSGGIILIACTIFAMIWANSPWSETYFHFIHLPIGLHIGDVHLTKSFLHWVNDGLMAIFFLMVGLEIKFELVSGELSNPKKAALPLFAAFGGMVAPALIYFSFNQSGPGSSGWGIPMATDIAFAVGILSLLGKRVPFALKIFLLALAIVDDLGAVLVIAFFYTDTISGSAIGLATLMLFLIYLLRQSGVRKFVVFFLLGIAAWFFVLSSGIHATIAGVLLGFLTPARAWYRKDTLPEAIEKSSKTLASSIRNNSTEREDELHHTTKTELKTLHELVVDAESPLDRMIHLLHPWVSFLIMPIFAFVNAGVPLSGTGFSELSSNSIFLGVFLGLLIGKPLGVGLACWIAIKTKMGEFPKGVTWPHLIGAGCLAGIGFTMALFITSLSLKNPELEVFSKLGILMASLTAAILGLAFLRFVKPSKS